MKIENHEHNGQDAKRVRLKNITYAAQDAENLVRASAAFFETVNEQPTAPPSSFLDQIKIYYDTELETYALYIYDTDLGNWVTVDIALPV